MMRATPSRLLQRTLTFAATLPKPGTCSAQSDISRCQTRTNPSVCPALVRAVQTSGKQPSVAWTVRVGSEQQEFSTAEARVSADREITLLLH